MYVNFQSFIWAANLIQLKLLICKYYIWIKLELN